MIRDLVIEMLADSECALLERVAELEAERDTYRAFTSVALTQLHELTRQRERLLLSHHRLIDEFRALRAQIGPDPIAWTD